MNKKLKLGILSLLGFSTACSTARHASQSSTETDPTAQQVDSIITPSDQPQYRIKVMYGVRPPKEIQALPQDQKDGQAQNEDSPKAE